MASAREGAGPADLDRGQALEQRAPRGMTSEGRGYRHVVPSDGVASVAPGRADQGRPRFPWPAPIRLEREPGWSLLGIAIGEQLHRALELSDGDLLALTSKAALEVRMRSAKCLEV